MNFFPLVTMIVSVSLWIYFVVLLGRLVQAVERIARKIESS